jgi:hypothetical protein
MLLLRVPPLVVVVVVVVLLLLLLLLLAGAAARATFSTDTRTAAWLPSAWAAANAAARSFKSDTIAWNSQRA